MKRTVRLFSIATSCQKTADPSKSLCQCHRRHHQIEIFHKFQFCHLTVEPCGKDSSDDSSINHKTVPRIFQKGKIFKNRRKLRDQIQKLRSSESTDHRPDRHIEDFVRIQRIFFRPVRGTEVCRQHTDGNHQSISVDCDRTNGKQFIFHGYLLLCFIFSRPPYYISMPRPVQSNYYQNYNPHLPVLWHVLPDTSESLPDAFSGSFSLPDLRRVP